MTELLLIIIIMFHVQLENSFTNGGAWMTSTVTDYYHGMYSLSLMVTSHSHPRMCRLELEPRSKSVRKELKWLMLDHTLDLVTRTNAHR